MNNSVMGKLKSNSGESIAETLVAVLIAAFALLMLAGTVNTSTNLVTKSIQVENEYYMRNNDIENRTASPIDGHTKVIISGLSGLGEEYDLPVNIYMNSRFDSKRVFVYDRK